MTKKKNEYCNTVPRTFVQDCLNPGFAKKVMFSSFFLRFLCLRLREKCRHYVIGSSDRVKECKCHRNPKWNPIESQR